MNEHDHVGNLLALASSGDVSAEELRRVQAHLLGCEECRRAGDDFAMLAGTLRSIPTPQPRAEVLARVRTLISTRRPPRRASWGEVRLVGPLVAASWGVAWISLPAMKTIAEWLIAGWRFSAERTGTMLAIYSILGLLLATVSAIAVGTQARVNGRSR